MKPVLSLEDHKEISASMQKIRSELLSIFKKMQPIAVTGKVSKTCHKSLKQLEELRSHLDNAFHDLISNDMFEKIRHIYYPIKGE
jgi:hypothetical protein